MKRFYHAIMRGVYRFISDDAAVHGHYKEAMYWLDEMDRKGHGRRAKG